MIDNGEERIMDPEIEKNIDQPEVASDAVPGGNDTMRRPGELTFAILLTCASLALLYSAYGISGFEALSSPGSVPMATTLVMVIAAGIVTFRTMHLPKITTETLSKDILPGTVVIFVCFLIVFGVLLNPLGFVPSAALFLIVGIKVLARRGWGYTLSVALGSLVIVWIVFRVVFTVLLPAGVLPEAEFIQFFRNLMSAGR
jgi:hypothetical protein